MGFLTTQSTDSPPSDFLVDENGNLLTDDIPVIIGGNVYILTADQGTFSDTGGIAIVNYLNRQHVRLKRTIKGN